MNVERRNYLKMLGGTAVLGGVAGCAEIEEQVNEEFLPDSFEHNRELTEDYQERFLREEGYDEYLELDRLYTQFTDIEGFPEVDHVDLESRIDTVFGGKYDDIGAYLNDPVGTTKLRKDLGPAIALMIHPAVGVYASADPVAEEPDRYEDALGSMTFKVRGRNGHGVGVHLDTTEVEELEQVYREHGETDSHTWGYVQGLVQRKMQGFRT